MFFIITFILTTFRHEKKKHESFIPQDVRPPPERDDEKPDYLFNYHSAKLTSGLILADINDAIREGDGGRLIQLYKMALPIYYSHDRTKEPVYNFITFGQNWSITAQTASLQTEMEPFLQCKGGKGAQHFTWSKTRIAKQPVEVIS